MSSRGGSSSSNGGGGQSIPAAARKMVQSLKEIVHCPDAEIYAMLKDCNMDPNEAVSRLLSQDPFHEVKSKREKEKRGFLEIHLVIHFTLFSQQNHGVSNTSNRVGRGGTDRYGGRGGSTQFSSSESGALHGKPAYKKENGTNNHTSPSSSVAFGMAGNNLNWQPPAQCDPVTTENKATTVGTVDGMLSSSQSPYRYQSAWSGVPGQVSMADIVKRGRSNGKASTTANPSQYDVSQHHVQASRSNVSHHEWRLYEDHASKVSEFNTEPVFGTGHHVSPNDDWPVIERPPSAGVPPVLEPHGASDLHADESNLFSASDLHADESNLFSDIINQRSQSSKDEIWAVEDAAIENINANHAGSALAANRKIQEDNSGGDFLVNDSIYENMDSYQPHKSALEHQEVEDVGASISSVTSNLQQLSVQEVCGTTLEEDNPNVIISQSPASPDCRLLAFELCCLQIISGLLFFAEILSTMWLRENASEENLIHGTGASAGSYDSPSSSQPEVLKQENTEALHENLYMFPSSTSNYNFENEQQLNAAFPHSQTSSQMQNLVPFSSVMQAYTNSLPSSLLEASVQPVRESDLPYSPFPMTQAMPTKYGNTVSSVSSSTISIPEALKTAGFSSSQSTAQTLPGNSIATGPSLPPHLAVHPYSQPTVPLGPYANMISYPFLPQSYAYMPSAFQQAFAGNSAFHQSLAAVLPQYKNNVSVSSLPQSAAIASGYGGFGSSNNIPGSFPMNPPAAPSPANIGYDEVMSSQYKDTNHLISLQQNENSAMWVHGPGSRTLSPVPGSTYYSLQGQTQPPSGYRQTQQPSQNYGGLNYPNFYLSQTGISLDHQQQNPRDGLLGGSQGQPSKQSHQQLWQNNY
ncbi:RNA polymerase II degradation factor-like protein [Actinidia rufa]|uniref:RNA polymerase II degradation factor-like protein n=1 Tax=Actinidia rufa TaxID=165716 RepID=A0A7J0DU75_9ERIC|nr:RNA polymerase II degradation factor-like protein [Actinidia rufa]